MICMNENILTSKNCIFVSREHGELIRRRLLQEMVLDYNYKIQSKDKFLILPLIDNTPASTIERILENVCEFTVGTCEMEPLEKDKSGNYRDYLDHLPNETLTQLPSSFDVIGNICTIKLQDTIANYGYDIATALMKAHSSIHGVFQDLGVTGEYRLRKLKHLGGEAGTETIHREFGIQLYVNISTVYFTPRLAEERDRISKIIQNNCKQSGSNNPKILDMFSGCGPFSIRLGRDIPQTTIIANDLNPHAISLLKKNAALNKVTNITALNLDANDLINFLAPDTTFDHIIMNLPHNSIDFLPNALSFVKSGLIHLYTITAKTELKKVQSTIQQKVSENNLILKDMETQELKGYSPQESVYVHDLTIAEKY